MSLLRKVFSAHTLDGGQSFDSFFRNFGSVSRSVAGESVAENTALTLSAYFAAIRNISEDIGKLPIRFFRLQRNGDKINVTIPRLRMVANLLTTQPNSDMCAPSIKETLTYHAINSGNGYAEIQRDGLGRPVALWPIHPDRVNIERNDDGEIVYHIASSLPGDLIFGTVKPNERFGVTIPQEDIFHIHGLGSNGLSGFPVLHLARDVVGIGLAQQGFQGSFYRNGTHLGGVLTTPERLSDDAYNHLRESWNDKFNGADRAHKPAILEQGLKWEAMSVSPKDAQSLESRKFNVIEIARILRIPPHKIQSLDNATFTNIESQNLEYTTDTLQPWVNRWEHEIKRKLIADNDLEVFAEFLFKELLRGTPTELSNLHKTYFAMGVMSPNEIRADINLNRVEDENADKHYVQLNLRAIEDEPEEVQEAQVIQGSENTPNDANDVEAIEALRPIFVDAAQRVVRKEVKAFDRVKTKFSDDAEKRDKWLDEFCKSHDMYIATAFKPAFTTIFGENNHGFNEIIANYWENSKSFSEDQKVLMLSEAMLSHAVEQKRVIDGIA